jgi:hypothetical protein
MKDQGNDHIEDHWKNLEKRIRAWDRIRIDLGGAAEEMEEAGSLLLIDRSNCFELTDELVTERNNLWRWIRALELWSGETMKDLLKDFCRIRENSILMCRALADRENVYSKYEMNSDKIDPDPEASTKEDFTFDESGIWLDGQHHKLRPNVRRVWKNFIEHRGEPMEPADFLPMRIDKEVRNMPPEIAQTIEHEPRRSYSVPRLQKKTT